LGPFGHLDHFRLQLLFECERCILGRAVFGRNFSSD
jgi:hypothetical protein